jgi:hypothetical protein
MANRSIPELEKVLHSTAHAIDRCQAARELGASGDAAAYPVLLAVLEEGVPNQVTARVMEALGHLGDPRAIAPLKAFMGRPDVPPDIGYHGACALGYLGDPQHVAWLTHFLSVPSMERTQFDNVEEIYNTAHAALTQLVKKSPGSIPLDELRKIVQTKGRIDFDVIEAFGERTGSMFVGVEMEALARAELARRGA